MVKKANVDVPHSGLKQELGRVLKEEGYINGMEIVGEGIMKNLHIALKYQHGGTPAIRSIRRVSKPGCRIYAKRDELPVVLNNTGIAIISTSKGVMTNFHAKKAGLGGEVLCEVS